MSVAAPAAVVDAPLVTPPTLSLVSQSKQPPAGDNPRWTAGFSYQPEGCGPHGAARVCAPDLSAPLDLDGSIVKFVPVVLWAADSCSAMGSIERDWQGRASRKLLASTPSDLEAEFWSGTIAQAEGLPNRHLTDASVTTDITGGGGAVAPNVALALLEQALATGAFGQRGMIHVISSLASEWTTFGLLRREGRYLLTGLDTIVVPGSGYPGTGPGDTSPAAGTTWAYATDEVTVRLSDPDFFGPDDGFGQGPMLDRDINRISYRAERFGAASFDGCRQYAVHVNTPTLP